MLSRGFTSSVVANGVLLVTLVCGAVGVTAQTQRPGDSAGKTPSDVGVGDAWDRFSVDISVRRSHVDKEGKSTGRNLPGVTYRLTREQTTGGWKTTFATISKSKRTVRGLDGMKEVDVDPDGAPVRMEDDEDGTPLRFYDAHGKRIEIPSRQSLVAQGLPAPETLPGLSASLGHGQASSRPRTAGRDWIEALVVPPDKKDSRKRAIEQKYGRSRGQVRGLDQFVTTTSDGQQEVLVDRESSVPLEMNMVKDGQLISRTTFTYERGAGNSLVRRGMRIEQLTAQSEGGDDKAQRLVSEIEFTNMRLEKKGGGR